MAPAHAGRAGSARSWRTWESKKIDLVEEDDGASQAFESRWSPVHRVRQPRRFMEAHRGARSAVATPEDWLDNLSQAAASSA
jgi:hypothetical protein